MFSGKITNDIIAAWGSTSLAVTLCSPLEVLKMNAQVTSQKYSIQRIFKSVYKNHGIRGYYKGLGVSLCAQPSYWMYYFPMYNYLETKYCKKDGTTIDFTKRMGIIFGINITGSVFTNPLFTLKTRFQTSALSQQTHIRYHNMVRDIFQYEGIRGFYKGWLLALIKNTQIMLQLPLYNYINDHPANPLNDHHIPLLDKSFISGVTAKTIASCGIYYPIDVIRTNIRNTVEKRSILQIILEIYKRPGGVTNFYRGVGIYWISAVPTFGFIMHFYKKLTIATKH